MIVRDAGRTLGSCLASVRPFVDELVIVDTGSIDNTVPIAMSFNAKVFHFPWCDDFAFARNESLRQAQGDWVFWMDADDVVPSECGESLRRLTEQPAHVLGVVVAHVHCPLPEAFNVVEHVKLVRNRPDLRFEGRVHEQIAPSIARAGGSIGQSDLYVIHSGADFSPAARERKRSYYLRLLEMDVREGRDNAFTLFNLGMTHYEGEDFRRAIEYFQRSLKKTRSQEEVVARCHESLTDCFRQLGNNERAQMACEEGLRLFRNHEGLLFQRGLLAHQAGRFGEAIRTFESQLNLPIPSRWGQLSGFRTKHKARHNLALAYLESGKPSLAEGQWRTIVEELPQIEPAWDGLAEALLRQSKYIAVEEVAERLGGVRGQILRARSALARNMLEDAKRLAATVEAGDNPAAWHALASFYFEAGWANEAEATLQSLLSLTPTDAAAHHNLGVLFAATNEDEKAISAFRASLQWRPDHPETERQLAALLKRSATIASTAPRRGKFRH